ncbi:histidine phosphatase family protein [Streptomyces sp. NPDC059445]|uniref:histidine phosphatase family protein n=1 Tax=Streptomyces sp. NPDC059445 TaxID=3346832 RepID=UPI003699EA96
MTSRVILISAAISEALREARFDDGSPVDASGLRAARSAAGAGAVPAGGRLWVSPTARCRQTAEALGLEGAAETPELAPLDVGRWRGATLTEVSAKEPEAVARWLADPTAAPHDGESVVAFCGRVTERLDTAAGFDGRTVAVVEPDVVRALVVRVLGAPEQAFWRVDVPPLTVTELSGRAGRWNLRAGRPLVGPA